MMPFTRARECLVGGRVDGLSGTQPRQHSIPVVFIVVVVVVVTRCTAPVMTPCSRARRVRGRRTKRSLLGAHPDSCNRPDPREPLIFNFPKVSTYPFIYIYIYNGGFRYSKVYKSRKRKRKKERKTPGYTVHCFQNMLKWVCTTELYISLTSPQQ
ncbi:hypothetical protein F5Y19DRAFT_340894 [Xylariaceae sp. FL1651]|nr:hypothetical protein F5Y19DRAFT_340894 [Xylariaceae sp. FL1651]